MTIPLLVLVSMGRFVVHPYTKGIACLWFDQGIKKRDSPILLITFDCELYTWIYAVDVIQERLLMGLLLNDPSFIHKPTTIPGGIWGRPECFPLKMLFTRLIKEPIFIRVNNPTLNRNIGKFQLSHIWDRVLFSTPNIKVAIPKGNVQHSP